MELEFDKEIDAILRRARGPAGAAVSTAAGAHIDADAVAAFSENALPQHTRRMYVEHFADCHDCRKLLSHTILMNAEAVETAVSAVAAPAVEAAVPWYLNIFKTPTLTLTMGALVLGFAGIIGLQMMQQRNAETSVASVTDQERGRGGPSSSSELPAAAANASAPAMNAPATNTASSSNTTTSTNTAPIMASNTAASPVTGGTGTGGGMPAQPSAEKPATLDAPKPILGAPAPPPADSPAAGSGKVAESTDDVSRREDKAKNKDEDAKTLAIDGRESRKEEDRNTRDGVPPASKKVGGPQRASGPRNITQNQIETNATGQSMITEGRTRRAGGKTFDQRNGIWYDIAYRGQATTNVRRGSDAYNKLDSGLRSIAASVDGTVVVVWKNKAYRIQ